MMPDSEDKYVSLFEHMTSGVAIYRTIDGGKSFVFSDFNPAAEKIENISKSQVIGRRLDEVFPGVSKFGLLEVLRRVWNTGKSEYLPKSPYSDSRVTDSWRENWVYKLQTGEVAAVYNDITSRVRAEEEVESQKNLFKNVISNIPNAVFWKDLNSVYFGCNENFAKAAGIGDAVNIFGKTDYDLPWTKDEADAFTAADKQIMRSGTPSLNIEETVRQSCGRIATVLTSKVPLRDSRGSIIGLLGIYNDITERKEMERSLSETARQWQSTFDASRDMIVLLDKEMRILKANRATAEYLNIPSDKFVGQFCYRIFHDADERISLCPLGKLLDTKLAQSAETIYVPERNIWFLVSVDKINDGTGNLIGYVHTMKDVTDQKNAELAIHKAYDELKVMQADLVQSEKMAAIGRFSAGIAHEVKNPLAVIVGCAELLENKLPHFDPDSMDTLEKIKDAALRANSILMSLLQYARPSALKVEIVAPHELASGVLPLFEKRFRESGVNVVTQFDDEQMRLSVDKNQMHQVIFNVIKNAIEAMPGGGTLTIRTYKKVMPELSQSNPSCVIEMQDTGSGISKENITKISEPFFSTKDRVAGTGLGLFMVKSILDKHKGRLAVKSEIGHGTTMRVILPITQD